MLFPTHEQVAVLALHADEIRARGVALAVLTDSLTHVQDKVSATHTLLGLAVPQPQTVVVHEGSELMACDNLMRLTSRRRTSAGERRRMNRSAFPLPSRLAMVSDLHRVWSDRLHQPSDCFDCRPDR